MRTLWTLFLLTFCVFAFGQNVQPPDYNRIEKNVKNPDSDLFYQKIMQRYQDNDTTLTHEEYRHLYYGYLFSDSYDSYWRCDCFNSLIPIYSKKELAIQDCDTIIKYAKRCYDQFPFDLQQINMIAYAYHLKGQEDIAIGWAHKVQSILDTILSTGDGKKSKSAWHVISTSHEYEIIKFFGLFAAGQELTKDYCDLIKISPNEYGVSKPLL